MFWVQYLEKNKQQQQLQNQTYTRISHQPIIIQNKCATSAAVAKHFIYTLKEESRLKTSIWIAGGEKKISKDLGCFTCAQRK